MYLRLLSIAVVVVCALIGWQFYTGKTAYERLQEAPHNQYLGAEKPALVITYVMDYRCAFCKQMHGDIQAALKDNPDLRIIFRVYPINRKDSIHEAKMAMAASKQGHFKDMHDFLILHQDPVTKPELEQFMFGVGLDKDLFYKDMTSWAATKDLLDSASAVEALGIESVPVFIVGTNIYLPKEGQTPKEVLDNIISQYKSPPITADTTQP
ncbi:MAG: thioredoxin domain-containing protein [Alphaproteobacteria bacterium]|nr:thioredoxin domain-containing protein [Alphaproteobacteria bacterium]